MENSSTSTTRRSSEDNYVAKWLVANNVIKKEEAPLEPSAGMPGTVAVIIRVPTDFINFTHLRSVLKPWRKNNYSALLRFSLALGVGECLVIAIWKANALEESRALMATVMRKFPNAWAMRFRGHDYEVGHWNELRLREILLEKAPLI